VDPVIAGLGQAVLSEMRDPQPLSRLRIDALGQDLAIHLLSAGPTWSARPGSREKRSGRACAVAGEARDRYMEEHLADDFRSRIFQDCSTSRPFISVAPSSSRPAYRLTAGGWPVA
jgi:hypothetical protein